MANYTIQLKDLEGNNLYPVISKDGFNDVLPINKGGTGATTNAELESLLNIPNLKLKSKLLWTNASPTSSFTAQTITLTDASYDLIAIRFKWSSSDNGGGAPLVCIKGAGQSGATSYESNRVQRYATYNDTGTVTFSAGIYNGSSNNSYCIPTQIWGI